VPTREEIQALIDVARDRAATEVLSWIPEKKGDRIAGTIVELGTITTKFGVYNTTTISPMGDAVENGENKTYEEKALVRVAWMGAVLVSTFLRLRPEPDDITAFHYQDDVAPQNGMNDYALIVAVVIDGSTLKARMPAEVAVNVPTREQLERVDARTGEIPSGTVTPGTSPLTPREGEEPLTTPAEDAAAALAAKGRKS
jgi:hypothetical protein